MLLVGLQRPSTLQSPRQSTHDNEMILESDDDEDDDCVVSVNLNKF